MWPNSTEQCTESHGFVAFRTTTSCIVIVGCVFASIVNILLIRCAIKLFQETQDAMHLFLTFMTSADLLLTAFAVPAELVSLTVIRPTSSLFCGLMRGSNYLGFAASGVFLALINVDKAAFFCCPLRYRLMSKKCAVLISSAVFTASLLVVASLWAFRVVYFEGPCKFFVSSHKDYVHDVFLIAVCMVPFLSSLVFSLILFRQYLNRRNATSHLPTMAFNNKIQSFAFIFTSSMWTGISLLPNRIWLIWHEHAHETLECPSPWLQWTAWTFALLLCLSPIGNCLITSLIYAPYRQDIARIVFGRKVILYPLPAVDEAFHHDCDVQTPAAKHQQKAEQNDHIAGTRHLPDGSAYSGADD